MRPYYIFFLILPLLICTKTAQAFMLCPEFKDEKNYVGKIKPLKFLVQGKDGWFFISKFDFEQDFSLDEKTIQELKDFSTRLKARGTELVLISPPPRGLMHHDKFPQNNPHLEGYNHDTALSNYKTKIKKLSDAGITIIGLDHMPEGKDYGYRQDHHWTPEGAKAIAQKVAKTLKSNPTFQTIKNVPFKTKIKENIDILGSSYKPIAKLCGHKIPPMDGALYNTERKAPLSQNILDEEPIPQIVLTGTSFSLNEKSSSNFAGSLKDALQADVLNLAISGGGITSSIMSYLNSQNFQDHPPKFLLWEVPSYYPLDHKKLYRQLIPAVSGRCTSQNAVAEFSTKLESIKTPLFLNIADKKISGDQYFIHLHFDHPVKDSFNIIFKYKDGAKRAFKFKRSKRYPHDGDFYLSFDNSDGVPVNTIELLPSKKLQSLTVTAHICTNN